MATKRPFTRLQVPDASRSVQNVIGDIYDKLAQAQTPESLAAINADVAAIQTQLKDLKAQVTAPASIPSSGGGGSSSTSPVQMPIIVGTHANRTQLVPINLAVGQQYWEIDRALFYMVQSIGGVNVWKYQSGYAATNQAGLAAFLTAYPALQTNDAGVLIWVSDYMHLHVWTGSALVFAPEDDGSAYYRLADAAPNAGLWHAVDGSTVNYLKPDGTLGSKVLPAATPAYLKVGTGADGALHPPVAPLFTGTPATSGNDSGSGTAVQSGAGTTVATHTHTHSVSATGTIDTTGEPENLFTSLWFRQ